jgi:hypothetical protein
VVLAVGVEPAGRGHPDDAPGAQIEAALVERTGNDAALELTDRERRRHVRAAVVDRDEAGRRVSDEDVEVAMGGPAHGALGQLRQGPGVDRDGARARAPGRLAAARRQWRGDADSLIRHRRDRSARRANHGFLSRPNECGAREPSRDRIGSEWSVASASAPKGARSQPGTGNWNPAILFG